MLGNSERLRHSQVVPLRCTPIPSKSGKRGDGIKEPETATKIAVRAGTFDCAVANQLPTESQPNHGSPNRRGLSTKVDGMAGTPPHESARSRPSKRSEVDRKSAAITVQCCAPSDASRQQLAFPQADYSIVYAHQGSSMSSTRQIPFMCVWPPFPCTGRWQLPMSIHRWFAGIGPGLSAHSTALGLDLAAKSGDFDIFAGDGRAEIRRVHQDTLP